MGLGVVPSVRGTLKCKSVVLDDRDVLVVIEGAVESIRYEVTEDQMMPGRGESGRGEGGRGEGGRGRQGVDTW